ncbi:MAG: MucB/RseB C-terminal domain-containing protein [Betaproteobacteria bacterium]|jgi:sigma-E factor negative regulatory protein RseB|nr:MucB/RseB C-terminal domain-containing protein [Betaproteobacteria bacterium]
MVMLSRGLFTTALMFGTVFPLPVSAAEPQREALAMLEKMAAASRKVNYSGTFVYNQGGQTETSRIAHFVNPAGGVLERLETLDGPAREVIRTNDQVICYLPLTKTVLIDPRGSRQFPVRLEQIQTLGQHYRVTLESTDRVAGVDCQWVALQPKDNLRYARRFCADIKTGLPLRARTLNEKNQVIESFTFSTLQIGGKFDRDLVRSRYAAQSKGWKVERSELSAADSGDSGWVVGQLPAGFGKLMELRRSMPGKPGTTTSHLVFSDGLAAISVFIEPLSQAKGKADGKPALRHQGAVHVYTRNVAGHAVTVLGETPAETVMQLARSLEPRTVVAAQPR